MKFKSKLYNFNIFLLVISVSIGPLNLFGSVFKIKDDFGNPINPSFVYSQNNFKINKNIISSDNDFIVFANSYLPQFVKVNNKVLRNVFLKKRRNFKIKTNTLNPIYILIKHKSCSKEYFEKYTISEPYLLPEIAENEILYIYQKGYYPIIFFENNYENKFINFEKADNFCHIIIENDMSDKTLFENNIIPDGYLAFKNGTILKVEGYAFEVLDRKIINDSKFNLEKESLVKFKKNCDIDFKIQRDNKFLKNYMYKVENESIKGLHSGTYTFVAKFGEIACEYFSKITIADPGYNLGIINCETANLKVLVKDEVGNPIENAIVDIYPKLEKSKTTDKVGETIFKLKIPRPIKVKVKRKDFAPFISERFSFDSSLNYQITLLKGSTLTFEYKHPGNKVLIRGFGIKKREGLSFKLENDVFVAKNIPPDKYRINFTDFSTNFTRKQILEIEEGNDYYINLSEMGTSLTGKIEPTLPEDFSGKIKLKSDNQTINVAIEKDSSFFLDNITFGKYTAFLKTKNESVIAVIENIIIDENSEDLTITLPGLFWSGFIKTQSSTVEESVIVNMYNNEGKLKWYFSISSGKSQFYIPDECNHMIFKYGNLKKKLSANELLSLDNIILE